MTVDSYRPCAGCDSVGESCRAISCPAVAAMVTSMSDKSDLPDGLMKVIDETGPVVAMWTGIRALFIEAGWSLSSAELMVIELFRSRDQKITPFE